MATVHEHLYIDAPYVGVVEPFSRRLGLTDEGKAGQCSLMLVAPLPDGREIARDVIAETKQLPGTANFTSHYSITWPSGLSARGIPTPGFVGTLTLRAGGDYDESELELDGQDSPPGGPVGVAFDGIFGRPLAHATLTALLDGMRRDLRDAHVRSEAEKHRV